ncbi:hypothetical protein PYps55T_168 [Yersinia phage PYps55T]|nr:hypothetical protein PYps55T_168 [Yersinia phage PYps55T]
MNIQTSEIDYNKISSSKEEMMRRFKESHDKAKAEGTITYKRRKFRSSNEPLYSVLCG